MLVFKEYYYLGVIVVVQTYMKRGQRSATVRPRDLVPTPNANHQVRSSRLSTIQYHALDYVKQVLIMLK